MTDYQYVVLSNRLTPFNADYDNNTVDVDYKKSSDLFSCNLSSPIKLSPYSEVKVCYFHVTNNNITSETSSLAIVCPNLPVESTNIGNPYNNRLSKIIGFIGHPNRDLKGGDEWFSCNNTHTETISTIDCQIIRLSDGRKPIDSESLAITAPERILVAKNITIGLQFRINPHKEALSIAYKNNELLRGHLSAFKANLINHNDPGFITAKDIIAPNYKTL